MSRDRLRSAPTDSHSNSPSPSSRRSSNRCKNCEECQNQSNRCIASQNPALTTYAENAKAQIEITHDERAQAIARRVRPLQHAAKVRQQSWPLGGALPALSSRCAFQGDSTDRELGVGRSTPRSDCLAS